MELFITQNGNAHRFPRLQSAISLLRSEIVRTKTTFISVHKIQNQKKAHNKRAQHQIHSNKQIIIYHSRFVKSIKDGEQRTTTTERHQHRTGSTG